MARVGIFGAGWVGMVTGCCLAELGHEVVVRDIVPAKIEALSRGELPFHEHGLAELLEANADRLSFTEQAADLADCAFLFVCVDTPPTPSGDADLSRVWRVIDELPTAVGHPVVVMKSTVPVGTGEKVRHGLDERGLKHVGYVSNPEFLAEGTAVRDFMYPDRIVIGAYDPPDGQAVADLYAAIESTEIVRCDVKSAEMIKLAANAFLMTRISFINEIANVCEATGADVVKVAQGIGLDRRLGPHFLRAGIGYGGSCLDGRETVLVRLGGRSWLTGLERLHDGLAGMPPLPLEVLAWEGAGSAPRFFPVSEVTRRDYDGELVELETKMGRRLLCTTDHPLLTADGVKLAGEIGENDWLPLAQGTPMSEAGAPARLDILDGIEALGSRADQLIVRTAGAVAALGDQEMAPALPGSSAGRRVDIRRHGALRLPEARTLGLDLGEASVGTARERTYVPLTIDADERFWRVVGLYLAEGHCMVDGSHHRLQWSFHPRDERHLVEEVAAFWRGLGVHCTVRTSPTASCVSVSSKLLAGWWLGALGLGATCYDHRLPDQVWSAPAAHRRALLSGLWQGDGSRAGARGGPSVVLEHGTASRELADGILRLLGDLGVVGGLNRRRTGTSTVETYSIVVSGADQVERLAELVAPADRPIVAASLARLRRRIAPSGYRRADGAAWVRVARVRRRHGPRQVYSLEVPGAHTFVTTAGLVVHNCFPKDSLALKQLASNSGYHFQLLAAVIEVNELQKRRVIGKLKRHPRRLTARQAGRAARPRLQARHRRHA